MQSSMSSSTNLEAANKEKKNKNKSKKKKNSNPEGAWQVVTWKSMMQSWSLQCKAPGLCCKVMAKAKTPAALLKLSCKKATRNNWGRLAGQEEEEEEEEEEEVKHNRVSLELLPTSNSQPPPLLPRRSNASSASGSTSTPLGSPYPSSKLAHLGSSFPSPSLSLSSSSSASRLRGLVSAPAGQRSFLHLFGGNQFLTHVTAAPVGGRRSADLAPSVGLVNVPRRHSDAHLRDRIIFFQ